MEHWKISARGRSGIVVTCRGHDRSGTLEPALAEFRALAATRSEFTMIADLREMTGYETESRVQWQRTLREYRSSVKRLVLVGARSALIRMGAAAVGAFAAVPVTFLEDWDELELWEKSA